MERQQIIYLCSAVVVGIILGLIIGWALWHGSDAFTCPGAGDRRHDPAHCIFFDAIRALKNG